MSHDYPEDLRYLDSHEYVRLDGDIATIGLSAFAIEELGDVVFIELPEVGESLVLGESFGSIESVKAVEELYPPVSGEILERNDGLIDDPEAIAADPYGEGWLLKVKVDNGEADLAQTMDAQSYQAKVQGT